VSLILKVAIGGQLPSPINNGRCSFGMPVDYRIRRSFNSTGSVVYGSRHCRAFPKSGRVHVATGIA
jgi:hypothetical protein